MEYRKLGRSSITVSQVGLGCVTFGREIDESTAFLVADRAFAQGVTLFDTADAYADGASETVLGKWIEARGVRNSAVICTKVGAPFSSNPSDKGCRPERIQRNLEASLRRLRVDCVDLYLLHCWDPTVPPLETLEALSELVRQGKVKAIGCSNYAGWQLCRMLWLADIRNLERMEVVQSPLNLVLGRHEMETELRPLCIDQQVGIMSYSPLGAGFLTGKYGRENVIPSGTRFDIIPSHQPLYFSSANYALVERLQQVSREVDVPVPVLAIAWVLQQSAITTTLIGARTPEQVDQVFTAMEFRGRDELLARLESSVT